MSKLDFNYIESKALPQLRNFLEQWLPGGDIIGHDYCPLNPTRKDEHKGSFRINLKTAQWHDFATGDKGNGLISLYAYLNKLSGFDSAKEIAKLLDISITEEKMKYLKYNTSDQYQTIKLDKNYDFINPEADYSWAYRDADGKIILVIDRFNNKDGGKKCYPRCYAENLTTHEKGWINKKLLKGNPLYNFEEFNQKQNLPILIVEGEKACEGAKKLYGSEFWCITWLGGSCTAKNADIDLLKERKIYLVPDNDEAGRKAMKELAERLKSENEVRIVDYPVSEFCDTWDLADPFPKNWDEDKFKNQIVISSVLADKTSLPAKDAKGNKSAEQNMLDDTQAYQGEFRPLELINEIISIIQEHIIIRQEEAVAIAYWILQTYNQNAFYYAPKLLIISPEKRCGKTTLLQLIEMLAYKPLPTSNCSQASLFKIIEKYQPTLLLDEADTFLKQNIDLTNIVNSSFDKKHPVYRSCGKNYEDFKKYDTFCMMAIASIGGLADTIMDRGIRINIRRKLNTETVQPLRAKIAEKRFKLLKEKCLKFMLDNGEKAGSKSFEYISGLNDRECNVWDGIISIAEIVGDKDRVISVARALSSSDNEATDSIRTALLKNILCIFKERDFKDIASQDLVASLIEIEEAPWATYNHGRALTTHALGRLLREFNISSFQKVVNGSNNKHYSFNSFTDVFSRYIPEDYNKLQRNLGEDGILELMEDKTTQNIDFSDIKFN